MRRAYIERGALSRVARVLAATWERYQDNHGDMLAAALSLYSLLALAPLAVIAVGVAGLLIDPTRARGAVLASVERSASHDVAAIVGRLVEAASQPSGGWAALPATLLLLWAASRVFVVLQEALNALWNVRPRPAEGLLASLRRLASKRLLSFVMVLGCGALLVGMLVLQTSLSALSTPLLERLGLSALASRFAFARQLALSFVLLGSVFAVIYRVLPDARIRWADVWLGSALTALIVLAGTLLLSLYLARIAPAWLVGAVGAAAALLLWLYYLAQVFLLGAALTRELACRRQGDAPEPESHAELTV